MITHSRYCWLVILGLARAAFFSVSYPTLFMICPPPLVPSLSVSLSLSSTVLACSVWNSRPSYISKFKIFEEFLLAERFFLFYLWIQYVNFLWLWIIGRPICCMWLDIMESLERWFLKSGVKYNLGLCVTPGSHNMHGGFWAFI